MIPNKHGARLREVLSGKRCVMASSVFDPMSARIADELGFEFGLMGGSVASYAVLGAPDVIVLTLTELVEQARRVCRAGRLSVLVDADHGYGNALNVMRTVEELEAAGVAGVTIEDTLLPRAFGSSSKPQLVSLDEGVGKMRAALAARRGDHGIAVFGRTSAASITGVDDAIQRLTAYQDCGVDALFLPGLKTRDELDRIAAAVKLPIILGGPDEKLCDLDYLSARGVRILMTGHQPFAAAVQAMYDTIKAVRGGTLPSKLPNLASNELMAKLMRADRYDGQAREFLSTK
jgi:carboxyvinyl-carboxyphosphonate phosphorylmutase